MRANCASVVEDIFLFCYEIDFMISLSIEKQSEVIKAFSWTFRYLDDSLDIDNIYFDVLISQIYPSELQLNKANSSEKKVPISD